MFKNMQKMKASLGCFAAVSKDMDDASFLETVKEKLHGQTPHASHLARMKCIATEICCCIKKNCGNMMKAMMSEEGCKLMAEWNLLCFDKNGDNVLDKDEFKLLMKSIAKKMMNKDLTDEEIDQKFSEIDKNSDNEISLEEFMGGQKMIMEKMMEFFNKATAFYDNLKSELDSQDPPHPLAFPKNMPNPHPRHMERMETIGEAMKEVHKNNEENWEKAKDSPEGVAIVAEW